MKKQYSAVLFDLDGTLLDTLDDLFDAVNFVLKSHGLPLRTREDVQGFIGNGIVKLMERSVGQVRVHEKIFRSSWKILNPITASIVRIKPSPMTG